jgi:hypothetical protein
MRSGWATLIRVEAETVRRSTDPGADGSSSTEVRRSPTVTRRGPRHSVSKLQPARSSLVGERATGHATGHPLQRTLGITQSLSSFQRTHCFKSWRGPDRRNLCFREHRSWLRRHISNHDCDRTRSKSPTHRRAHLVEFASMRLRL